MNQILQTAITIAVIASPAFLLGFATAALLATRRIHNRHR
jgi:hypothetical protein